MEAPTELPSCEQQAKLFFPERQVFVHHDLPVCPAERLPPVLLSDRETGKLYVCPRRVERFMALTLFLTYSALVYVFLFLLLSIERFVFCVRSSAFMRKVCAHLGDAHCVFPWFFNYVFQ